MFQALTQSAEGRHSWNVHNGNITDVLMAISWREFANTYFQRPSSWFYHKMDGIDGNGGQGGFNEEEAEQMRGALIDLSNRIRKAAENI